MTLKLWFMTLVEYDAFGRGKIIRSFTRAAKDSDVKEGKKKSFSKMVPQVGEDVEMGW